MQTEAKFPLGQLLATPAVLSEVNRSDILEALGRHMVGDWGDLDPEDIQLNEWSLENGERLLSAYRNPDGVKFWIITERDRSSTTILLPSDY